MEHFSVRLLNATWKRLRMREILWGITAGSVLVSLAPAFVKYLWDVTYRHLPKWLATEYSRPERLRYPIFVTLLVLLALVASPFAEWMSRLYRSWRVAHSSRSLV
jgi:hypothetical protein